MRSKRLIYRVLSIPMAVIFLMILIVKLDTFDNGISRAMASKAMALAFTDKENCLASQKENGSYFDTKEQGEWYAKYVDFLLENGYFEAVTNHAEAGTDREEAGGIAPGAVFKADRDFAMDSLTYGEAAFAAERVAPGLSGALNISKNKYKKPMPEKEWWLFYDSFLRAAAPDGEVKEEKLLLYGTPDNVKEAASWTAYTDRGIMNFEGLSLDACIDHEIRVLTRGTEIIHLSENVSDKVTYRNVWLMPGEGGKMKLYVGTIVRQFPAADKVEKETAGVLADVVIDRGKLKKISLKKDTIEGKVLSVRDDAIEIEGYGTLKLDSDFRVYKTYGMVREQKKRDILVGYDPGRFVVAGRKVCAALLSHDFSAENIRVLIMNDSFTSLFHEKIVLSSQSALQLEYGEESEILESGQELVITAGDERLAGGRLMVKPMEPHREITVSNVKRSQGAPSYFGSFEISTEPEGLLLVNDVDVEDYLTRVVPSEMPPSYELEALKAQAVCARTYAFRQIQANAYSRYGAHVDDSTNYQVYNNIESSEKTDLAVRETDGKLVFYGEKPAETYYFSTSCGYSTDGTVWGASLDEVPYLRGTSLEEGKAVADLMSNDAFLPFIQGQGNRNYDSGFPMYRWKTTITNKKLAEKVDSIGEIQGIFVTERGTGGIAKTVKIVGSEGERVLKGQSEIRKVLGCPELTYKKNDGTEQTGWATLPSAFIAVDETARDKEKELRTFTIWGGGYGHGVGMSQNGAQEMARRGKSYEEILRFFYDGVEVREWEKSASEN